MGFAVGFVQGAANELLREQANTQDAQQAWLDQQNLNFDRMIMPAVRKQQQEATQLSDTYNKFLGYRADDGTQVLPEVARQAALTDPDGTKTNPIDLINQSRATLAQRAKNPGQAPTNPQPTQTQAAFGQTTSAPQAGGGSASASPLGAPTGQGSPQGGMGQPGMPPASPQPGNGPQNGQPQNAQGPALAGAPPQEQQRTMMNKIGDLLLGRVGNDQLRQQFIQQAAAKYNVNPSQIIDIIAKYNNPQSPGSQLPQGGGPIAATPTLEDTSHALTATGSSGGAAAYLKGDAVGAAKADEAAASQDDADKRTADLKAFKQQSDYSEMNGEKLAKFKENLAAEDNGIAVTPEAMHDKALYGLYTGQDPRFYGKNGPKLQAAYLNAQTQVRQELGLTPQDVMAMRSAVAAGQGGVNQLAKTYMSTEAFAKTAMDNMDAALKFAPSAVGPTGMPVFDKWVQAGRVATGDPDVAKLETMLDTAAMETAKVLQGGYGAQGVTESMAKEIRNQFNTAVNVEQLKAKFDGLNIDIANRRRDYAKQLSYGQAIVASGGRVGWDYEGGPSNSFNNPSPTQGSKRGTITSNGFVYDAQTGKPIGKVNNGGQQ